MADITVTNREVSTYGRKMRSTGSFVHEDSADYTIQTGLGRVDFYRATCVSSNDGPDQIVYLNSNTTSDNVSGYEGVVYVDADGSPTLKDGETYLFEAIGV